MTPEPYFLGDAEALFGVYHPPSTPSRWGAVLCPPFAFEAIRAHRAIRLTAEALARSGMHTLRLDLRGTGDSAASLTEVGVATWIEDLEVAIEELREGCDAEHIVLIGLRLGAHLVARCSGADLCVLWDPVSDGARYVEDLEREHEAWFHGLSGTRSGPDELFGFEVPQRLRDELRGLSWAELPAGAPRILVAETEPGVPLGFEGAQVEFVHAPGPQIWRKAEGDLDGGTLNRALQEAMLRWLSSAAGLQYTPAHARRRRR